MEAIFKVGSQDFTSMIPEGGIKWSRNDLDSAKAGRTLDGVMHRKRVSIKRKLGISIRRCSTAELMELNRAICPEYIQVTFLDAIDGICTKTFYGSTVEAATQIVEDGETYWKDISFSLIER